MELTVHVASGMDFEWLQVGDYGVSANGRAHVKYDASDKKIVVSASNNDSYTVFYDTTVGSFSTGSTLFMIDGYAGDVVDVENSWLPSVSGGEYEPFLGWYTEEPDDSSQYRPSEDTKATGSVTLNDDVYLYGAWTLPEATTVDVTFHWNYEGADPESVVVAANIDSDGNWSLPVSKVPSASREGFTLTCWQSADGSNMYMAGTPCSVDLIEWYAVWEEEAPTSDLVITYIVNGESVEQMADAGDLIGLVVPYDFTENSLIFDGLFWDDAYETPVEEGTVLGDESVTVYVKTIPVGRLILDPSDPEGTMGLEEEYYDYVLGYSISGQAAFADSDYELLTALPELVAADGSEFLGWTDEDGNDVTEETPFGEDDDPITLYAKWNKTEAEVYTVTFDPNGGEFVMEGGTNTVEVAPGDPVSDFPAVAKTNSSFVEWNTEQDGSGDAIDAGFIPEGDITLYAQYDADKATVVFDTTGGELPEGESNTMEVTVGDALGSVPSDPVREGYTFDGWFTDANTGDAVTADTVVNGSVTYYAHWTLNSGEAESVVTDAWFEEDEYTVTQGDTDALSQIVVKWSPEDATDADFTYSTNDSTILSSSDGSAIDTFGEEVGDVLVTATNSAGVMAETTVHVVAEGGPDNPDDPDTIYTITFDPAGGSAVDPIEGKAGDVVTLPSSEREGYTFNGWLDSYGEAVSNEYTISADATLYADWIEGDAPVETKEFTVTFDANGGSACDAATVEEGQSVTLPETSREGYTFAGWFDPSGAKVEGEYTPTDDVTLTAHWDEIPVEPEKQEFTVTFDANGGDNVDPVTVEEGESLMIPGGTREGYTFDGWFDADGNKIEGEYTPTGDITLTARWTEIPVEPEKEQYTVTFDAAGGSECDAVTVEEGQSVTIPETIREGYTFDGWFTPSGSKVGTTFTPDADITLTARWTKEDEPIPETKKFTVTFDAAGGTAVDAVTVDEGQSVAIPSTEREGYTFDGWFDADGNKVEGDYTPTADVTLTAHWTEVPVEPEKEQYTVTFDAAGGSECEAVTVEEGQSVTLPETTREGFTFDGWFTASGTKAVSPFVPTEDTTLTAKWTENTPIEPEKKEFTVTFNSSGGDEVDPVTVEEGQSVTLPTIERAGFTFDGWYDTEGVKQVGEYTPTADTTLYARWIEDPKPQETTYTVVFDAQNGNPTASVEVKKGESVDSFPEVSREGYTLLGWFDKSAGGNAITAPFTPESNMTVYAQWTEVPVVKSHSLIVSANGGTFADGSSVYAPTTKLEEGKDIWNNVSTLIPSRPNYDFTGFYDDDDVLVYDVNGAAVDSPYFKDGLFIGTDDLTVHANWTKILTKYTLTYDANGGSECAPVQYNSGDVVNGFSETTREGYTFLGWFDAKEGGNKVTSLVMDSDKTLYAHWEEGTTPEPDVWHIYYDTNGGDPLDPDVYPANTTVTTFKTPTWTGHEFLGWFLEKDSGTQRIKSMTRHSDITIYAHWSIEHCTITYDLNGGMLNGKSGKVTVDAEYGSKIILPAPTRDGYLFDYWEGSRYEAGDEYTVTEDHTLKAIWVEDEKPEIKHYTLTFDSNGGSISSASAEYEEGTVVNASSFPTPSRTGYTFDGWFDAKEGGNKVDSVTMTKDVTVYAQWTKNDEPEPVDEYYTLTFDANGGEVSEGSRTEKKGTRIEASQFPTPTRDGYRFVAWYTDPTDGVKVSAVNMLSNLTLYAHWKKVYTVTFDYQDGSRKESYMADEGAVLQSYFADASREGYTFLGWFDAPTGGTKVTSYKVVGDKTFYVQWKDASGDTPTPTDEVKAESLVLSDHSLAVTKGDRINLTYTLLPANTTNKSLTWTTSDQNVVSISLTGNNQIKFDAVGVGQAIIRVATKDGSNLSDTCTITVKAAGSSDTPSPSGGGTTPTPVSPTSSSTTDQVDRYVLQVELPDGSKRKVEVNPDITLGKLAVALQYKNVAKWTLKQANVSEYEVSENITMKELAALLKNGDLLIIAYDSAGKALGSAKVEKISDSEMKVTISKDTNVALKSASEAEAAGAAADGKGKGETSSKPAEEKPGKVDEVAPVTPTGDTFGYLVYGILGTMLVLAGGIYLFIRRRVSR